MPGMVNPDDIASFSIRLQILEGRNLVAKDRSLIGKKTTSDPWVEVFLGDKNYGHKTEVIPKTLNPKWDKSTASFKIMLMGDHARNVLKHAHPFRLVIWDKDIAVDDCMGVVDIPILEGDNTSTEPQWFPVEKGTPDERAEGQRIHYCKNPSGELKLQYTIQLKTKADALG